MRPDEQNLINAVKTGDLETVLNLSDSHNINKATLKDTLNNPILCLALQSVDVNKPDTVEIVKYLIAEAYPLDTANKFGDMPLHIAVKKRHFELIELLVEQGANLHAQNKLRKTPIDLAAAANVDLEAIYKKQQTDRQKAIQMQQALQAPAPASNVSQQDVSKRKWPRPPTSWTPEQISIVQSQLEGLIDDIEEGIPIELRGVSILSLQAIIRDECHDKFKEFIEDKEVFTAIEKHLKSQSKDVYKILSSLGQQLDILRKIYRHPYPHNRSYSDPDYNACSKKDPVTYPAVPIGYVAVKKDNRFLQKTPPMAEQKAYLKDDHNGYFFEPQGMLSLNNVSDFVSEKHKLSTANEVKEYIEDCVDRFTHAWQTAKATLEEAEVKNNPHYQENHAEKEAVESLYHKILRNLTYEIKKSGKSTNLPKPPKVFISYAWDADCHNPEKNITQRFIENKLAKDLRRLGFEPFYDHQDFKPGDNLKEKMQQQVNKCDYIIMLCTPLYKQRVSIPCGVQVEVEAIYDRLSKKQMTANAIGKFTKGNAEVNKHIFTDSKVIPVILKGSFNEAVPILLTETGGKRPIQITDTLITYLYDETYQEGMLEIAHTLLKFFLIENGYQGDLLGNIYANGGRPKFYKDVFEQGKKAILARQYKDSVEHYNKRLQKKDRLKEEGKYMSGNLYNPDYKRFDEKERIPKNIINHVLAGNYSKELSFFPPNPKPPTPKPAPSAEEIIRQKSGEVREKRQVTEREVTELLKEVGKGHLNEVKAMLQSNRSLLYAQGEMVDVTDKTYKDITVLQYAYMVGDIDMCEMILGKFKELGEEGTQMIRYQLNSEVIKARGGVYALKETLEAYEAYIKSFDANYKAGNYDQLKKDWCQKIGGCQKSWPAWLRYDFTQEGGDAPWCKQSVCGRPQKRDGSAYGLGVFKVDRYKLGDDAAWVRGPGRAAALPRPTIMRVHHRRGPQYSDFIFKQFCSIELNHDQKGLNNEEAAIQGYRATLEKRFQLSHGSREIASETLAQKPTPQPSMG